MGEVIDLRHDSLEKEMNELNKRIENLVNHIRQRDEFEKSLMRHLDEINENTYWTGHLIRSICTHYCIPVPVNE